MGRSTLSGTVALIVLGGLVGTAGGLIYSPCVRGWPTTGRWKGLLLGVLLLAVLGPSIIRGQNFDFYVFGPPLLNVTTSAFGLAFMTGSVLFMALTIVGFGPGGRSMP